MDNTLPNKEQKTPPVDGGLHAWLFLAACFVVEGTVWGFASCFGVFQSHYRREPAFEGSMAIAAIGTCAMGMAYLLAPVVMALLIAVPGLQRWSSCLGFTVISVALALSSFAKTVTHLILAQGIAYGAAGCLAYSPSILFMPEWFVKRKSLAFGIVWSGSGLTGIIFPIILQHLLTQYGWQTTLRISSVAIFLLAAPVMPFHKPRLPTSTTTTTTTTNNNDNKKKLNLSFHRNKTYLIYQAGNTLQSLGFFLPQIFLPSYAESLGATPLLSSTTITVFNIASIFGCIGIGYLADRSHVSNCLLLCTAGSVLSTFILWGLATHLAPLYIFAVAYGSTAGAFAATWSGISNEVQHAHGTCDASMVFSFLQTGRGVGNVVSGPLSEAILSAGLWEGSAFAAYGSSFGGLVVFTGLTGLLGGVGVFARFMKLI
ncbi:major facilitator superfamily domain-containing protein [Aspergillus avenaceus]|uniref:Major facilitator superfamily domain-containing protein n=1 Tax=Aspergillus avenaceus TaxID=36643 RepID=A0A5N6TX52_ASPAV|nr:major facilitator superfamily domain-containing protein [Aspergillus avenaceus]